MANYLDFESRYRALQNRDPDAEGKFVYAVTSTGIVCRPTCSSRLALAKNIVFFDSVDRATERGFRPCKRCRPEVCADWNHTRNCVASACSIINVWALTGKKLDVDRVAQQVGLSKWHFCRVFKNYTDYTPRKFYLLCRQGLCRVKKLPLILTRRFLARSKVASEHNGKLVAETLDFSHKSATENANSAGAIDFPELEFSDLDTPELDWCELDWCGLLDPGFLILDESGLIPSEISPAGVTTTVLI